MQQKVHKQVVNQQPELEPVVSPQQVECGQTLLEYSEHVLRQDPHRFFDVINIIKVDYFNAQNDGIDVDPQTVAESIAAIVNTN